MFKNKKGFTLIELLIVITIIGILAVAFLPTILDAPSKGRDSRRVQDLNSIKSAIAEAQVADNVTVPAILNGCVNETNLSPIMTNLQNKIPVDPSGADNDAGLAVHATQSCPGQYYMGTATNYSHVFVAKLESDENVADGVSCAALKADIEDANTAPTGPTDACYVVYIN